MNIEKMRAFVSAKWKNSIIEELESYIRIPAKSPAFDPEWAKHGYLRQVIQNGADWARRHAPESATITTHQLPHRTPILTIDIPGTVSGNILLYGHLDKQPEMSGWREGLGPWKPVLKEGKLYFTVEGLPTMDIHFMQQSQPSRVLMSRTFPILGASF